MFKAQYNILLISHLHLLNRVAVPLLSAYNTCFQKARATLWYLFTPRERVRYRCGAARICKFLVLFIQLATELCAHHALLCCFRRPELFLGRIFHDQ
jgi:hypothetical protein